MQTTVTTPLRQKLPHGSRLTKQRFTILDFVRRMTIHPTAEMVYKEVSKVLPRMSFTTVYRNLRYLTAHGFVATRSFEDGVDRFEGNLSEHGHFFCQKCWRIYDIPEITDTSLKKVLASSKIGHINRYTMTIYGVCRLCQYL
ncbi:MAG: transcriptional repressor [Parcubacteria group bacterium]|nr:transcriptional repressor [Parcubacteria group bacterium]